MSGSKTDPKPLVKYVFNEVFYQIFSLKIPKNIVLSILIYKTFLTY